MELCVLIAKKSGKFASYEGETGRPAKVKFKEHIRSLKNKSKASALFKHGTNEHPNEKPDWQFNILATFQEIRWEKQLINLPT